MRTTVPMDRWARLLAASHSWKCCQPVTNQILNSSRFAPTNTSLTRIRLATATRAARWEDKVVAACAVSRPIWAERTALLQLSRAEPDSDIKCC